MPVRLRTDSVGRIARRDQSLWIQWLSPDPSTESEVPVEAILPWHIQMQHIIFPETTHADPMRENMYVIDSYL